MTFKYTEDDKFRFLKNIIRTNREDGVNHCWVWHGDHNVSNYGVFANSSKEKFAHRFSYSLHHGEIPVGLTVDHICEIRPCVNPDHLQLKTRSENSKLIGTRDVVNLLYTRTNQEYNIMENAVPALHNISKCVKSIEDAHLDVGLRKFKEYDHTCNFGEKIVVDILDMMLQNMYIIFTDCSDVEFVAGYKKKWYWYFIMYQIEWYPTTTLRDLFDHYMPLLMSGYWAAHQPQLERRIDDLMDVLESIELTSPQHIMNTIKEKENEIVELKKQYVESGI